MAIIIPPQDIPSELYDQFRAIAGLARPNDVVERRYPWRIIQPATPQQVDVWNKFLYCTRCFEDQSPEQRAWWYEQSQGSGLFYYNYFMKETLALLHQDIIPDWCSECFSEFFPGTKLDLVKWLKPVIEPEGPEADTSGTYWVNELFYFKQFGTHNIIFSLLQTRDFKLSASFELEFNVSLSWGNRDQVQTTVFGFSISPYFDVVLATGFLRNLLPYPCPYLCGAFRADGINWNRITEPLWPGRVYHFKLGYNGDTNSLKVSIDDVLKLDIVHVLETDKNLRFELWSDFGGPGSQTHILGVLDNIVVHCL